MSGSIVTEWYHTAFMKVVCLSALAALPHGTFLSKPNFEEEVEREYGYFMLQLLVSLVSN